MPRRAFPIALLAGLAPALAGGQVRLRPEFQANVYTTGTQSLPAVASAADGRFILAWETPGLDGTGGDIVARRYDPAGAALDPAEFPVGSYATGDQRFVAAASDPSGRAVLVWSSETQDGSGTGVFGRLYDAAGTPGAEFQANSYTTGAQTQPSVAFDADGSFVVVWHGSDDGHGYGVFGQCYDNTGAAQGSAFQANSYTTLHQTRPAVAAAGEGRFVVVWQSRQDGDGYGVFGQRYSACGLRQGGEFQVNAHTTSPQSTPSVAAHADGGFMVAWDSFGQDGSQWGVFGQRYDASGNAQGGEFQVNSHTTQNQTSPSLAADAHGRLVVTWHSRVPDGGYDVFARLYDAAGTPGGEFRVNADTTGDQRVPSVAADPGGNFVVVWAGPDGGGTGILAQRFAPEVDFEDGFESGDLSAWSASATRSGHLDVHPSAAMKSTAYGLRGIVEAESTAPLYVQDDSPRDESRYRARFYFDTNGFDPGEAQNRHRIRLFLAFEEDPVRRLVAIVLRRLGGVYSLMGRARLDDNSQYNTGFSAIADGEHVVELDWKRASGPDAGDGTFELWIDGVSVHAAANLDNSISAVDFVRMGALSLKRGAEGTLHWDEFVSGRSSYIGP